MFEFVAKHKRLIQIVFVLLIVPPFAFFGLESYTRGVRGGDDVASVDGMAITQREFGEALREQQDRLRALFGGNFDVAALDTPAARLQVLESLVAQRVVNAEAVRSNLVLSREAVIEEIKSAPDFQEGGKFSPERYQAYLRSRNLSDEGNVQLLRHQLPVSRLVGAVQGTAIPSRSVAERLAALEGQKREVSEALVPASQFAAQVKADEAALKAYYDANSAEFRVPERVRAEYVVLSAEELARAEAPTEAEIKAAYEARAADFRVEEQRRASHILVKTREEADRLLAEARKSPPGFGELAKKHSQDPGSADKGGDLGLFGRGMMVKPFEDAVFAMKPGEIAGPVQSDFGFHVIRLDEIQAGKGRKLEEVRDEVAKELARQKGARKFAEAADGLNNMVYEQSDSLKPAADRFKLKVQTSGWITRSGAPDLGVLNHPKLLAALFSADATQKRRNTDAVEVAPGVLVAARVAAHEPATQRKLEEAKAEVEQRLRRAEAAKLARQDGEAKLAELRKGGDAGLKWSAPKSVSRREPKELPPDALRAVMSADAANLPAYVGVDRGAEGYALYRVAKIVPAEGRSEQQKNDDLARFERFAGNEQLESYVASLRARAKVEINEANLQKK
jgi:peptidyl-prolyl cis-trans isomerase D